jgi:hypothetical protein
MQPIAWRDAADADVPTAQDFLPDRRDQDCVIDVMVGGITGRDCLKSKLCDKTDNAGIAWLKR